MVGWLGPCTNHGSRQPAADESRGALSHLEAGARIVAADSIRNLGQEDRAAVMPHRHPRQTTSRNGYCANEITKHGGKGEWQTSVQSLPFWFRRQTEWSTQTAASAFP